MTEKVELLDIPAPSVTVMVMTFDPGARGMLADQVVVPVAVPLPPVATFDHVTWETVPELDALPVTTRGEVEVLVGGEFTVTPGGVPPPDDVL